MLNFLRKLFCILLTCVCYMIEDVWNIFNIFNGEIHFKGQTVYKITAKEKIQISVQIPQCNFSMHW